MALSVVCSPMEQTNQLDCFRVDDHILNPMGSGVISAFKIEIREINYQDDHRWLKSLARTVSPCRTTSLSHSGMAGKSESRSHDPTISGNMAFVQHHSFLCPRDGQPQLFTRWCMSTNIKTWTDTTRRCSSKASLHTLIITLVHFDSPKSLVIKSTTSAFP